MLMRCLKLSFPVVALLSFTACRDRDIAAYRAPKDPPPAAAPSAGVTGTNDLPHGHPPVAGNEAGAPPSMADTPVPTAEGPGLTWTAPADWAANPLSAMRKGSFTVKGDGGEADLSITAFPGDTGGLAANLNRWRGQVTLPPQEAAELEAAIEKMDANGLQFLVVDYANHGSRLLGAVLSYNGNSWFFKLTGPDALVAHAKPAFLDFLRTVKAAN
jgi:hypothetical protein